MQFRLFTRGAIVLGIAGAMGALGQATGAETPGSVRDGYRAPAAIVKELEHLAGKGGAAARVQVLGNSPGGRPLALLQVGPGTTPTPGVLVIANMEGNTPFASEAALKLAQRLVGEWSDAQKGRTWYILPVGNPDGYARFFASPLAVDFGNERSVDADLDDAVNEDGPDDLNSDGFITVMRQKHPEGTWLPVADNPLLMKEADAGKGEAGLYRVFTESLDNDGDGELNEDGPGGANPGHNFPHSFRHYTTTDGPWAASELESRAVLEFAFAHPDIAMVIVFGRANTLAAVPEGSKSSESGGGKYKIPKRFAEGMGVSPDEEFPIGEIVEMARDYTGFQGLTEEMVLQFLGVGAATKPDGKDVAYWSEISKRYTEFLKEQKLDAKRLDAPEPAPGSVEEWAYYQFGVPAFAVDFWSAPVKEEESKKEEGALTPDELEKMSNDEFIALGKEKIDAFLKANDAPAQYTADMVIMGLKGGMMDTKKMAEFIRKAKKKDEGGGADETEAALLAFRPEAFVAWTPYLHPTLGEVEIGGMVPYADLAPPHAMLDSLLEKQLPFVRTLAGLLPEIALENVSIQRKAPDVWRVEAWVANNGYLPLPTYQGQRCGRPSPAVVKLEGPGLTLLEGRARQVTGLLPGSGGSQKMTWLLRAPEGTTFTLSAETFSAGRVEDKQTLKEEAR
jgi:hypothetical protein